MCVCVCVCERERVRVSQVVSSILLKQMPLTLYFWVCFLVFKRVADFWKCPASFLMFSERKHIEFHINNYTVYLSSRLIAEVWNIYTIVYLLQFCQRVCHSCQVYNMIDWDKVENIINACEARAKFYRPRPLLSDHTHFWAIMYCHTH